MPIPVVEYVVPWCLMCQKVKDDLLEPYVRKGIISLTVCCIGISEMLPAEISPDMYDYASFLYGETGRAITPTIKIIDDKETIFLQAMSYKEFQSAFEQSLREVMSGAF